MSGVQGAQRLDLLALIVRDRDLPPGYDRWGIRSARGVGDVDGKAWPTSGLVRAKDVQVVRDHMFAKPRLAGGLVLAITWSGLQTDPLSSPLRLVAFASVDVVGPAAFRGNFRIVDSTRIRVKKAFVVEALDAITTIRDHGRGTNLINSQLNCAKLDNANLKNADLKHAHLYRASLRNADLRGADLRYAKLQRADLSGAQTEGANFANAEYSSTTWPYDGFDPEAAGAVPQTHFMDSYDDL